MKPVSMASPTTPIQRGKPVGAAEGTGPGRSADSVGHRAKLAIAGATLPEGSPRNIMGEVASRIARGLSLADLLGIQETEGDQPPEESGAVGPAPDPVPDVVGDPAPETVGDPAADPVPVA